MAARKIRPYRRLSDAERLKVGTDLRKLYEGGNSIRELVELTGRSYGFIHRALTEAGTQLRGRGYYRRPSNTTE